MPNGRGCRRADGGRKRRHKVTMAPGDPLFVVLTLLELGAGRYFS